MVWRRQRKIQTIPSGFEPPESNIATRPGLNPILVQESLLLRIRNLFKVQLDNLGVILAVLPLHILDDLRLQFARQLAPALTGVLLHVGTQQTLVDAAVARGALRSRRRV